MNASRILIVLALGAVGWTFGCSSEPDPREAPGFVEGEVLVRYHKDLAEADEDAFLQRHALTRLRKHPRIRVDHVRLAEGKDVAGTLDKLQDDPDVLYVEPNFLLKPCTVPNDLGSKQWFLGNDGSYGTAGVDIGAREAWDITKGSHDIVVAVVDTGVDWDHPDLAANIWNNHDEIAGNGVDDDNNGYRDDVHGWDFYSNDSNPDDWDSHGTHVAGAIGAVGNNGQGVVGVNWDVRIMPLRFMGGGSGSLSDAAAAIEYAVANGADVINASFGSYGYSYTLRDAIAEASDAGVLFVAAAGNEDNDNDSYAFYPAGYDLPNVVSVASTNSSDRVSSFSNYGDQSVHVAAPGEDIYSTYAGGGYGWMSGTSMASPVVAGAAALALSADPTLSPADLKQLIMETSYTSSNLSSWTSSGGRLDAAALIERVADHTPPEEEEPPPEEEEPPPEEEEPPPEEEEPPPSNWSEVSHSASSRHPYRNNSSLYWVIDASGASEMRVHFDWLDVEQGYDYIHLADREGNAYATYTGNLGSFVSDPIPADEVVVWLISDYSVRNYGFEIAGYSWR